MKYEELTNDLGNKFIIRNNGDETVTYIPLDENNSDYQRYLRWLENPDADESGTL